MTDVCMCTASIWHMCTMSMDRYFTLRYPMKYGRNKTKKMVALKICSVWIISLAISSPIAISGFTDYSNVFNNGVCVPTMTNFIIYGSLFAFYIPLLIMIVTYVLTLLILYRNQKHMHNSKMRHSKSDSFRSSIGSNVGQTATIMQCQLSGIQEEPISIEKQKSSEARTQRISHQSTSSSVSSISSDGGNSRKFSVEDLETGVINRASSCTMLTSRGTSSDTPPRPRSQTVSMNPLQNLTKNAFLSLLVTMGTPLELKPKEDLVDIKAHSFSSMVADTIERLSSSHQGSNWSQNDCKNLEERQPFCRPDSKTGPFLHINSPPGSRSSSISSAECKEYNAANDDDGSMEYDEHHLYDNNNKERQLPGNYNAVQNKKQHRSAINCEQDCHSFSNNNQVKHHIHDGINPNSNLELKSPSFPIEDVINTSQNNVQSTSSHASTTSVHSGASDNLHVSSSSNIYSGIKVLRQEFPNNCFVEQRDTPSNGYVPSDPPSNGYVPSDPPSNGHAHSFLTNGSAPNSVQETDILHSDHEENSDHSTKISKPNTNKKKSRFWEILATRFRDYKTRVSENQINNGQDNTTPTVTVPKENQNLLMPPGPLEAVTTSGAHLQVGGTTTINNASRNSSVVFQAHSDINHSSSSNGVVIHPDEPQPPNVPTKKFGTCCEPVQTLCQTGLDFVHRCRLSCAAAKTVDKKISLESLRRNNKLSRHRASNEKKASKVLGIIFAIFVILWAPFFVLNVLSVTCTPCMAETTEDTFTVFVWLGYVASLANPIIYTMFNTSFRRAFIRILTCKKTHRHHHHYHYGRTLAAEHRVRHRSMSLRE
ncbi:uncharacterized protein LOC106160954 [Lingula anatina]|uniref:Uncharacterized protein LOC106160954 n=1 Tax=Lingula anatina TaxID=7574 RepID=A0A1S3I4M9_LINAN|nr:uncharacterized protein LOC106160954 [Lingula anatina]|eukprot:XP_013393222.2 uncharacterized protein LOC106160954 [Lingula anatina]